ncbi:hypothetical protein [Photobacterium rosenbergii]|uniref:Pilus assembly protein PapC n=1 Tax=Photobacterium rosenbergii TaxID=294936 RepID=A0ABU3ZJW9_9GAMM|nr:hypothetical protein [Photobacterium rosenbergii]MDV5170400.1 hypothetical protein [Photobacterium rosenbergii]
MRNRKVNLYNALILIIFILFSRNLYAALSPCEEMAFEMPLPLLYYQRELGDVLAKTDGHQVCSVNKNNLLYFISPILNDEALKWTHSYDKQYISIPELKQQGILIDFIAESFSLSVRLDDGKDRVQNLNSELGFVGMPPTASGPFSAISSFSVEYDYSDASDSSDTAVFQWLGGFNWGGHQGVNLMTNASFGYLYDDDSQRNEWQGLRGPMVLYHDRYQQPARYSLGDVSSPSAGHLPNYELGGFSIYRNFSDLQPDRNIQNTGSQFFQLSESAEVEFYVNGIYVTRYRLEPGRYNVDNLPLSSGNNDVRLEINYLSGRTDTLYFSRYYNATLLKAGLSDFGFSIGSISEYDYRDITYSDEYMLSGYYDYGLSDNLTAGFNGLVSDNGGLMGLSAVTGNFLGNFALRLTYGHYREHEYSHGYIGSIDYEQSVLGSGVSSGANFRLGYEYQEKFSSTPWEIGGQDDGYTYYLDYTAYPSDAIDFSVGARVSNYDESAQYDTYYFLTNYYFRKNQNTFRVGLRGEYNSDSFLDNDEYSIHLNLSWDWTSNNQRYSSSVRYDTDDNRVAADFSRSSDFGIGGLGYRLSAESNDDYDRQSGNIYYVANRWRGNANVSRYGSQSSEDEIAASMYLSTTLGYTEGRFGVGSEPVGPFTVVSTHQSLDGLDVEINGYYGENPNAIATHQLPAIVGLNRAFTTNQVSVDIPDAPPGLDYGNSRYTIVPGSLTGHLTHIGTDAVYTVIGRLLDQLSNPVALKSFNIVGENAMYSTFTNRNGRFVVEGMIPGNYMIHQSTDPSVRALLILVEADDPLVFLEPITLSEPEKVQFEATGANPDVKAEISVDEARTTGKIRTVNTGDTIWKYAYDEIKRVKRLNGIQFSTGEKYRLTISFSDFVISVNKLVNGNIIHPGQSIFVPDMESFITDYDKAMRLSF